jgi:hypothetical protein
MLGSDAQFEQFHRQSSYSRLIQSFEQHRAGRQVLDQLNRQIIADEGSQMLTVVHGLEDSVKHATDVRYVIPELNHRLVPRTDLYFGPLANEEQIETVRAGIVIPTFQYDSWRDVSAFGSSTPRTQVRQGMAMIFGASPADFVKTVQDLYEEHNSEPSLLDPNLDRPLLTIAIGQHAIDEQIAELVIRRTMSFEQLNRLVILMDQASKVSTSMLYRT